MIPYHLDYDDSVWLPVPSEPTEQWPDELVEHRDLSDGTVLVVVLYDDARHELVPADVLDSVDVTPTLADRSTWLPAGS